ncbi:MAG: hypothetical protein RXQ93_01735 [Caldisphaera sp.]
MSSGIIIGILSNLLQYYQILSLSLVVLAITFAFAGSAMEIMYLLILKRVEKILLNKNESLVLSVILIAILMMLYFVVIGMPLVQYYQKNSLKRLSQLSQNYKNCIFDNPLLSLITFGYGLSIYQACNGLNISNIINNTINNLDLSIKK